MHCDSLSNSIIKTANADSVLTLIKNNYTIFEANIIHQNSNKLLSEDFNNLIENYEKYSQIELDSRALITFDNLYKKVDLGSLSDSNDYRRQSMRAAFCFSSIGICSENNYSYYLDLAIHSLTEKNKPIEFLEDFYLTQLLVNIYIYNLKGSEHGIRMSIKSYRDIIDNFELTSSFHQTINNLILNIEENLEESQK